MLIEGVLFNVKYLGSTHSEFEGRSEKEDRIHQAEMAVHEVKVSLVTKLLDEIIDCWTELKLLTSFQFSSVMANRKLRLRFSYLYLPRKSWFLTTSTGRS